MNELQTHTITLGDTLTPLAVTLTQSDSPVNLTGKTVKFQMVAHNGAIVIAETSDNVSIVAPTQGRVNYDFQAADVDTLGTYWAWFTVYVGAERDTFPVDGRKLRIDIVAAA
jgi:hypothetical protein